MRIAIETLGTRGDMQPYLALALALLRRGHEVQLAVPQQYASFVAAKGVACAPLPAEFLAILDTPEGKTAIAGGGQGFGAGLRLVKHWKPLMRRLGDAEWAAIRRFGADLIVYHPKSLAPHIAESLGVPAILASPLPGFTPTTAFPSPLLPFESLGPLNKVSHLLATNGAQIIFRSTLGEWRAATLGLDGHKARVKPSATVYAYSRHVLPVPPDWGEDVLVSGYWFLDEAERWQMPDDLAAFLASGDNPVYVGFGSLPGLDPRKLAQVVVEGLAKAGKRGLLAIGGGALDFSGAPHIHVIESAPHDALFPHMAAAFHHGGAGTTGASLRAGLPTIVCPLFGDQPFWGRRVARLGAGPEPLNRKALDASKVAAALRATDDIGMRARARDLGEKIRGEDGVSSAVSFIERHGRHAVPA